MNFSQDFEEPLKNLTGANPYGVAPSGGMHPNYYTMIDDLQNQVSRINKIVDP
jgi:hypothetical protein